MTDENDKAPPYRIGWKMGVTALLVLAYVFYTVAADGDDTEPANDRPGIERHEAWGACQDAVKARLDNPATADFAILTTEDVERADGGFDFSGSLSADNAFGVEQELIFSCEVAPGGSATAEVRPAR